MRSLLHEIRGLYRDNPGTMIFAHVAGGIAGLLVHYGLDEPAGQ